MMEVRLPNFQDFVHDPFGVYPPVDEEKKAYEPPQPLSDHEIQILIRRINKGRHFSDLTLEELYG